VAVVLPELVASPIQRVRSRHDPAMAAKISPHVTLIYEVPNELLLARRLATACADLPPFRIRLEDPRCWGYGPSGGIYLPVEDTDEGIASLRRHVLGPPFATGRPEHAR